MKVEGTVPDSSLYMLDMVLQGFSGRFGVIFSLICNLNFSIADGSTTHFVSVPTHCNHQWKIPEAKMKGLDLTPASAVCLALQNDPKCLGVKCNSSSSNCEIVEAPSVSPITCIENPLTPEDGIFIRDDFVQRQSELFIINLKFGELVPFSVRDISPIRIAKGWPSPLHVQVGNDILMCHEDSTKCQFWTARTNIWDMFPSLNIEHIEGSMNIVGGKIVVIGGKSNATNCHGIVEIYDPITRQWILGPELVPNRKRLTTVALNESSLVVVGGQDTADPLTSVKVLDINAKSWSDFPDLPNPKENMICGMVNVTYLVCLGGSNKSSKVKAAFSLDMSTSDPSWKRSPLFDADESTVDGFIIRLDDRLLNLVKQNGTKDTILREMSLSDESPSWKIIKAYPAYKFDSVSAYVVDGYSIHP